MADNIFKHCFLLFISLVLRFLLTHSAPETALVTELPGFNGTLPSKHYAGYVTIDENHGKKLFYYFVVSERNPSTDPLVLWLNGGPGCSSFDGFVYEHGPFNFEAGKTPTSMPKLHINPYSWTKVSSIVYLDSPSGVGFSYSKDQSDYVTGDLKTASDSHAFLLKWFELYPEFLSNPFYIVGESYAGAYVPTLASEVVKGIDAGVVPILNFKGYMVGNGVADEKFDGNALLPFVHGMGLISDDLFKEVISECNGNYYEPTSESCANKLDKVDQAVADINIYDILEPCYHAPGTIKMITDNTELPLSFRSLDEADSFFPVRVRMFGRAWPVRAPVRAGVVPTWPQLLKKVVVPCYNDEVATAWLNDEAVRAAIHAEPANVSVPWEICTDRVNFTSDAGSMIPYHKNLTSRGYRALIYSGDHDMAVPFTGSQAWTRSLGYKIVDEWRPWYVNDSQVAGYLQGYDYNLTFLTIKGAGHTVPQYKPFEAFAFYSRWLEGKTL